MRTHRTPSRVLFTPHRVAGGPGRGVQLHKSRVTTGMFPNTGEEFKIEDRYTEPRTAHLMLEHAWVGTSEFREDLHESIEDKKFSWADWAYEEDDAAIDYAGASGFRLGARRPIYSLVARAVSRDEQAHSRLI